jgi:hypothetical protein
MHFSIFAKIILLFLFLQNFCAYGYFAKTYLQKKLWKNILFMKIVTKPNIFAKIWQNLMSSKYFHKSGPFSYHTTLYLADKLLFCNKLKGKTTIVSFCHFHIFPRAIFAKM